MNQTPAQGLSPELREIIHAIWRRKWLLVLTMIAVGAATAVGTMRQPKVYQAVAQLIIDPVLPKVLGEGADINDLTEKARAESAFYNTQYRILQGRRVVRATIQKMKLHQNKDYLSDHGIVSEDGKPIQVQDVEEVFSAQVRVAPDATSRVVALVVEDFDSARAAKIANAMVQVYIDQALEQRLATSRSASKWLDQRVAEFGSKLENAEQKLYSFKKDNTLVSVSLQDRQNMTTAAMTKLNDTLIDTRAKLIALESRREMIKQELAKENGQPEKDPQVAKSEVVAALKTALAHLRQKEAELSTRYGDKHPNFIAVKRQIEETKRQRDAEVKLILDSVESEYLALARTEVELKKTMASEKQKALGLNSLTLDYNKLSRDFGTTKTMYETLLRRQAQADLSGLLEENYARWMETAEADPIPIRPSVPKNTAVGAILGLLLGVVIAVGGVLLDNTVHSQADIEEVLQLPFLGILPSIPEEALENGPPNTRDLYISHNPKSSVAECARSIRTNLMFVGTDKSMKRILLTSAGPAEGKSTTSITLGTTMAQADKKVVIIDTDLRRPRLHRTFGVSGEQGLTSVLLETCTLDEAIRKTDQVGMDVLPCGPLPPNPAELLHTERFVKILEMLGEKYDRILLDSPPINAVTDAVILSQMVDGIILVVKSSKTAKDAVRRASRKLQDVQANVLGVVLNDVDMEEGGYGHHYYYNRYYGYGADAENSA